MAMTFTHNVFVYEKRFFFSYFFINILARIFTRLFVNLAAHASNVFYPILDLLIT